MRAPSGLFAPSIVCLLASALVLRFSFSEDCAKGVKSEHWCGAAKNAVSGCEAKDAFLFQFCTTAVRPPVFGPNYLI
jgi:hypothetical protein